MHNISPLQIKVYKNAAEWFSAEKWLGIAGCFPLEKEQFGISAYCFYTLTLMLDQMWPKTACRRMTASVCVQLKDFHCTFQG